MLIQTKLDAAECFLQHHNVVSELTTRFGDISAGVAGAVSDSSTVLYKLSTI